ncbi:MAG: hypothetical protein Q9157_000771 [Trypethelium eluteriae]
MEGYAKIAQLMGAYPEFAIFRRFRTLNMQNLLYLQAELMHLETELAIIASDDNKHASRQAYPHDWWSMAHGQGESDNKQREVVLKIQEKLEKYNDALLKLSAVSDLPGPADHDLQFFRSWYERPKMGAFPLYGLDRNAWSLENEHDLTAVMARKAPDSFSHWFTDTLIPMFHQLVGEKIKSPISDKLGEGLYEYNEKTLKVVARVISTVVASVLPLCSVVILYIVKANGVRLGIIIALSACFSLALALMTNARQIEIFSATSA